MIAVIIAGGIGTRLWPLSTTEFPKHLLQLNDDASLLQLSYMRAKRLTNHVYVITEGSHAHHVRNQLPQLGEEAFIVEPARRGTAGCIIAGLHYIQARHPHNEPIAFVTADHVIHDVDGFAHSFKIASKVSEQYGRITLLGIEPTYAATGFGYIKKAKLIDESKQVYRVAGFTEKPSFDIAKKYMRSGRYLWNCSYFVGSVDTFVQALGKYAPQWNGYYQKLLTTKTKQQYKNAYLSFENNSIDYALMEQNKELLVVPASFDWMDVGSFNELHGAVDSDAQGNYVRGQHIALKGVENSFIRNDEPDKLVGVIGLDNVVVVNTPHGLLVARKDLAQSVKELLNELNKGREN